MTVLATRESAARNDVVQFHEDDEPFPRRASRDSLLATGAAVVAFGYFLGVIAAILSLVDSLQTDTRISLRIADGLDVGWAALSVASFAVATAAFLVRRERRARLLCLAAILLGVSWLVGISPDVIRAVETANHHAPGTLTASFVTQAVAEGAIAAVAIVLFVAFSASFTALLARRDRRLGSASVIGSVGFALMVVGVVLFLIFYADAGASGGLTTGLGIYVAGYAIAIAASALAAIAFFLSAHRLERSQPDWLSGREGLLGIAASVFALAFLIAGVGVMVEAAAEPGNGFSGLTIAGDWLSGIRQLIFAGAAVCVSVGFLLARRRARGSEQRGYPRTEILDG